MPIRQKTGTRQKPRIKGFEIVQISTMVTATHICECSPTRPPAPVPSPALLGWVGSGVLRGLSGMMISSTLTPSSECFSDTWESSSDCRGEKRLQHLHMKMAGFSVRKNTYAVSPSRKPRSLPSPPGKSRGLPRGAVASLPPCVSRGHGRARQLPSNPVGRCRRGRCVLLAMWPSLKRQTPAQRGSLQRSSLPHPPPGPVLGLVGGGVGVGRELLRGCAEPSADGKSPRTRSKCGQAAFPGMKGD